jgi:hypothetical protein
MTRILLAILVLACGRNGGVAQPGDLVYFKGVCDASAAESLTDEWIAVADDEDNAIRVYSRREGGRPLLVRDLSAYLRVERRSPEADLEGAARMGDRIYWISSHGRNAKGRFRPNRGQLFATTGTVTNGVIDVRPIGAPYHGLLADLLRDPRLAAFGLRRAAQLPPKTPGGLNIEGLAATTNGHLLIGFRNPAPGGRALVVPLLNPGELPWRQPARLGDPILLDLGGLGIRSIVRCRDRFLIMAGSHADGGGFRLFDWDGASAAPRPVEGIDLRGLNPEAIAVFPNPRGGTELFLTSDDGTRIVDGKPCKELRDPERKYFRGMSLVVP